MSEKEYLSLALSGKRPLRIAFTVYRGNPTSGGQGVYTRYLTREIAALGHGVEVFSGQPYPEVERGVGLTRVSSLDLYRDEDPFRIPKLREFRDLVDLKEFAIMSTGGFPEPRTFGMRVYSALKSNGAKYDLLHDNQSLSWSILRLQNEGMPTLASIHHPITIDKKLGLEHAEGIKQRFGVARFYGFVRMQTKVAKRIEHLLTVSNTSAIDISKEMGVELSRLSVVPIGVDPTTFRPLEGVEREQGLIVTTASADVPLKGLSYLVEAVRMLKASGNCDLKLAIIGQPKAESPVQRSVEKLGLKDSVQFLGRVSQIEMVGLYARASVAVVPSLYEGFSLPAIEIMACGVPLIVTDGGALPEVVGGDGIAARIVRAGDSSALAREIAAVLSDAESAQKMGNRAILRARSKFSWKAAALGTIDKYLEVLDRATTGRSETTEATSSDSDAFLDEVAP